MSRQIQHWLWCGFAGMVIAAVGCFVLRPQIFLAYPWLGFSYYGSFLPTAIPYVLGNSISVVCMVVAAARMPVPSPQLRTMRTILFVIASCLAAIILTPQVANKFIYWVHLGVAVMLFVIACGAALWVMACSDCTTLDRLLGVILVVGSALALLSAPYFRVISFLALGQLLALGAAMFAIIRGVTRWLAEEEL
jgi:hypothetical protein